MGKEIERKFLIDKKEWLSVDKPAGVHFHQGYLCIEPERTVRVRLTDANAYITIKGKMKNTSRSEYEYEIPKEDASQMIRDLAIGSVSKIRYKIIFQNKLWEVDEFFGKNEGLLLAEIELDEVDEKFAIPGWVTKEVTADKRYYNANLVMNPYENWKDQASFISSL